MRSLVASILFASLTGAGLAAPAQEAPPAWAGVWQGTVGKVEVKLCLQHEYRARGAYYYARYLRVIALEGDDKARPDPLTVALTEAMPVPGKAGKAGGTEAVAWTLRASTDRRTLEGSWRSSAKTLPVQLTRLAAPGPDERSCETDAFSLPLERPGRVAASDARLKGTAYRTLSLVVEQQPDVGIAAFELLRDDAGAVRFNAAMRKLLQDEQEAMFGCMRGALGSNASIGDYGMRVEPKAIGRRWLVAGEGGSQTCGGAHPNHHLGYQTWDLEAGRTVDPWTWFGTQGRRGQGRGRREIALHLGRDRRGAARAARQALAAQRRRLRRRAREPGLLDAVPDRGRHGFPAAAVPRPDGMQRGRPRAVDQDRAAAERSGTPLGRVAARRFRGAAGALSGAPHGGA